MNEQQVILVNEIDEPIGLAGKTEAHEKGMLHRAFSIFIFDSKGRMLIHQRAAEKYHGAHLWTNACCSHPKPGEETLAAACRRLKEELGFDTELKEVFSFTYHARVENNLVEHEFDHVFVGEYEGEMDPDPAEVAALAYENMAQLKLAIENQPEKFTTWFRIAFPKIENWWKNKYVGKETN
jgi:isopentenyl-diphosphate delta-isomerase